MKPANNDATVINNKSMAALSLLGRGALGTQKKAGTWPASLRLYPALGRV
jgi:hypothetical protein